MRALAAILAFMLPVAVAWAQPTLESDDSEIVAHYRTFREDHDRVAGTIGAITGLLRVNALCTSGSVSSIDHRMVERRFTLLRLTLSEQQEALAVASERIAEGRTLALGGLAGCAQAASANRVARLFLEAMDR